MRSKETPGGHSSQCTYGKNGNLLTTNPAAGTIDYRAVDTDKGSHMDHDVSPYQLADSLGRKDDYYKVRPLK